MAERKVRSDPKIIGYWMSEKKSQKLNWTEFASVCRRHGYSLVKINLDMPLEIQGPFSVILHKLTDIIAQTIQGNSKAVAMIEQVEAYIENHPEVAVIDPLENVRKLLDRYVSYRIIHDSNLEEIAALMAADQHFRDVFTPAFVELTSHDVRTNSLRLQDAGVGYPFVCKPSVAHGTSDCHKMTVIFNEAGLVDCKPPCVAQSFINHNAVLFKLYVLGDSFRVVERPSLKNFTASNRKSIYFDSHDVSKPDSTSSLSILDPEDMPQNKTSVTADPSKLAAIVSTVRERLGMALLGIDVVVENTTGRHAIIDINAYPGYDGYPNFFEGLMSCILKKISDHDANIKAPKAQEPARKDSEDEQRSRSRMDQDDSGFDTSDSSDEKKLKQRLRCSIGAKKLGERQH